MSRSQRINDAPSYALKPVTLVIDDESSGHNVPVGAESHFKVTAVSWATSLAMTPFYQLDEHQPVLRRGIYEVSVQFYDEDFYLWYSSLTLSM